VVASKLEPVVLLWQLESMKITVELSDTDIKELCALTGERKKGPAIRKLVLDALMLKRRERLAQKFITGEWGVDLKGFEDDDFQKIASASNLNAKVLKRPTS
jgi:hypothetical protein